MQYAMRVNFVFALVIPEDIKTGSDSLDLTEIFAVASPSTAQPNWKAERNKTSIGNKVLTIGINIFCVYFAAVYIQLTK